MLFNRPAAQQSTEEKIQVFPQWLMSLYNLEDQPFKLLDESIATYKDLKIPCSAAINETFLEPLEAEIAEAFSKGYEGVKALDEQAFSVDQQAAIRHYF
jgi:hypothetical protein